MSLRDNFFLSAKSNMSSCCIVMNNTSLKPAWNWAAIMRCWFPLVLILLVTGCDLGYGIYRRAQVPFMPEPALVGTTIKETPGVDKVRYHFSEDGGRPLTWSGLKPADQVYTFSYYGGTNVHGALQFLVDYKGTVKYSQYLMQLGSKPPQAWLDATHPVMLQIESRLEQNCGLTNLSKTVKESSRGVKVK